MNTKKRSISASLHITAGDRDRTFLVLVSLDGKELGGLTFYSEPTSEPSCGYTSKRLFRTLFASYDSLTSFPVICSGMSSKH